MRSLLFFLGLALIALSNGTPDGLPHHSGSAKAALPHLLQGVVAWFGGDEGRWIGTILGACMVAISFSPWLRKKKDE